MDSSFGIAVDRWSIYDVCGLSPTYESAAVMAVASKFDGIWCSLMSLVCFALPCLGLPCPLFDQRIPRSSRRHMLRRTGES